MEEKNETNQVEGSVSDAVFGTSSDAIIEGLHQGILTAQSFNDTPEDEPGDKNQIVNQQDQQDITNATEDDDYAASGTTGAVAQQALDSSPAMSKEEAASILSENDHLDEAGDSEEGISAQNTEKDKIN